MATLSVLGASTRYGLSWLTILLFPMLATIQIISAQVGLVAKQGLQRAVSRTYGRYWGMVLLISVLAVNLVTIGADIEGGAAALGLLFHAPWQWFVLPFAVGLLVILFLGTYDNIQRILKYVLLVFAAYVAAAFLSHPNWGKVLQATISPPISLNHTYVEGALALLGTTLTSYAYVWESIEEAEERQSITELGLAKADAGFGMFFAVAVFWFILISTGATLGAHHKQIQTAQQAAEALKPVAGPLAADLFAIGLLASAMLAVPVLAASSGYIVSSEFGFRCGLSASIRTAWRFYAIIAATMLVGVIVSFLGVSPIQLLFVSGIIGGLGTPISLVFLLAIARDHKVMHDHAIGRVLTTIGWTVAIVMASISAYFLWQQFGSNL